MTESIPAMWLFLDLYLMFLPKPSRKRISYPPTLIPVFLLKSLFRLIGMMGEACFPSNAYFPWIPDYTPFILGPCLSV